MWQGGGVTPQGPPAGAVGRCALVARPVESGGALPCNGRWTRWVDAGEDRQSSPPTTASRPSWEHMRAGRATACICQDAMDPEESKKKRNAGWCLYSTKCCGALRLGSFLLPPSILFANPLLWSHLLTHPSPSSPPLPCACLDELQLSPLDERLDTAIAHAHRVAVRNRDGCRRVGPARGAGGGQG